ncbi:MAG: hypothetical protein FWG87_14735 [Defluviitaleaceae bacterium]|nr:hypothetical protein [Defluviitaleaceae bacterium]
MPDPNSIDYNYYEAFKKAEEAYSDLHDEFEPMRLKFLRREITRMEFTPVLEEWLNGLKSYVIPENENADKKLQTSSNRRALSRRFIEIGDGERILDNNAASQRAFYTALEYGVEALLSAVDENNMDNVSGAIEDIIIAYGRIKGGHDTDELTAEIINRVIQAYRLVQAEAVIGF